MLNLQPEIVTPGGVMQPESLVPKLGGSHAHRPYAQDGIVR